MKPFFAVVVLATLFGAPLAAAGVGDMAPDFRFEKTWNTDATRLSDILAKRKFIILEQFATW